MDNKSIFYEVINLLEHNNTRKSIDVATNILLVLNGIRTAYLIQDAEQIIIDTSFFEYIQSIGLKVQSILQGILVVRTELKLDITRFDNEENESIYLSELLNFVCKQPDSQIDDYKTFRGYVSINDNDIYKNVDFITYMCRTHRESADSDDEIVGKENIQRIILYCNALFCEFLTFHCEEEFNYSTNTVKQMYTNRLKQQDNTLTLHGFDDETFLGEMLLGNISMKFVKDGYFTENNLDFLIKNPRYVLILFVLYDDRDAFAFIDPQNDLDTIEEYMCNFLIEFFKHLRSLKQLIESLRKLFQTLQVQGLIYNDGNSDIFFNDLIAEIIKIFTN